MNTAADPVVTETPTPETMATKLTALAAVPVGLGTHKEIAAGVHGLLFDVISFVDYLEARVKSLEARLAAKL
ncbi:MAG: hypothetical protein WBR15_10895 [Gammaproteobacteria bacterium]